MSSTTPQNQNVDAEAGDVKDGGSVLDTKASHEEFGDPAEPIRNRRLLWKVDLFILPIISSVYFFASMGRSDIGNAKIAGMTDDLKLSPKDYSNATTMFLVGYVVFQLPGTLLIKKISAPIQFGAAMLLWGLFTALEVVIKNTAQLFAMRFLIGLAEAFVQGGVFYLSFWYQYGELATRGAIFYSMSTIAGAFNGLIAYGIAKDLDGVNGWRAWRWIFLIEGVMPIAFSFIVFALLPSSPHSVRWGFSPTEKEQLIQRSERAHNSAEARMELKKIPVVLLSVHFWLFVIIACASHFCLGSLSNFLPAIINGFGFSTVDAQLFTVIVYVCGSVGIIFWARIADKTNARGLTLAVSLILAVVGYALVIATESRDARFAGTCLIAFSVYPSIVLQLSWSAMNFAGYTRRGSTLAFFNIFSQLFSISGNQAYQDPPYYRKGNSAALGLVATMLVFALITRWYLGYLNTKKKAAQYTEEAARKRLQSIEELGDLHPDFFYTT